MSKSKTDKQTKSKAKAETSKALTAKVTKVTKTAVHEGVNDTAYQRLLDKAVASYRNAQGASLVWAWELGEMFVDFENTIVTKTAGRTIDVLIKDLDDRGIADIGQSTLYFSKRVFLKYPKASLVDMAAAGCGTGILKLLFGLENESKLLEMVNAKLIREDGTMISTRDLGKLITESRQAAAIATSQEAAATTPTPRAEKEARSSPQSHTVEHADDTPVEAPAAGTSPAAPAAAGKPDDGKTGTRGATPVKTYSMSPQKALKTTDNAATKLISSLGDVIIAATEITKIGFDHEPTKNTVRQLLASTTTAVAELLKALPDVKQRLQEALDDVSG
jgi:hypothetical protein